MIKMFRRALCILGLFSLFVTGVAYADQPHYSLGLGLEFSTGKYGTDTRTNAVFVPLSVAVFPNDRLDFFLELPFVYQSNNNVVSRLGGSMHNSQTSTGSTTMMGSGSGMGGGGMGEGGIGDITLKAGYVMFPEGDKLPQIRPNVFVKFPTADKNKSLGTGEFDGGVAVAFWKWFEKWGTFAEAGYAIQGKSSSIPLKNYLYYSTGVGYQVSDSFRPMLILKGSTEPVAGIDPLLEARVKLRYQASKQVGIEGYLAKGITKSSPDVGTGIAVYYDF